MDYDYFFEIYCEHLNGEDYELFERIVDATPRLGGAFRIGNFADQLQNNLSTSRSIRFGNFLEDVVTEYIAEMGYINMDKWITNILDADQLFYNEQTDDIFLIEQKVRDDHDSSKLRGQFQNFELKCEELSQQYPDCNIYAAVWFTDDSITSNRRFWENCIGEMDIPNVSAGLYYGQALYEEFFDEDRTGEWEELNDYLWEVKKSSAFDIPDYDQSHSGLEVLKAYQENHPRKFHALATSEKYEELREYLFPTWHNMSEMGY